MAKLTDLIGPAAIGSLASVGALFAGPPGVGLTGLLVCGSIFVLAARADRQDDEQRTLQRLNDAIAPPPPPRVVAPLEHRVLRAWPPPHRITPCQARHELRAFLHDPRNARIRRDLRREFRIALSTTEYHAHAAGEIITAGQWLHRARGRLVRAGLLP